MKIVQSNTHSKIPSQQRGAVLVMALVTLLVMTLLGVTILNTTSLENKMAGNMQEAMRAIGTAESGLEYWFQNGGQGRLSLNAPGDFYIEPTQLTVGANHTSGKQTYIQCTKPPRAKNLRGIYGQEKAVVFIQISSTGQASTGAIAQADQGMYQPTTQETSPNGPCQ
jgi:Tfp pilus assembly protein PilX